MKGKEKGDNMAMVKFKKDNSKNRKLKTYKIDKDQIQKQDTTSKMIRENYTILKTDIKFLDNDNKKLFKYEKDKKGAKKCNKVALWY